MAARTRTGRPLNRRSARDLTSDIEGEQTSNALQQNNQSNSAAAAEEGSEIHGQTSNSSAPAASGSSSSDPNPSQTAPAVVVQSGSPAGATMQHGTSVMMAQSIVQLHSLNCDQITKFREDVIKQRITFKGRYTNEDRNSRIDLKIRGVLSTLWPAALMNTAFKDLPEKWTDAEDEDFFRVLMNKYGKKTATFQTDGLVTRLADVPIKWTWPVDSREADQYSADDE